MSEKQLDLLKEQLAPLSPQEKLELAQFLTEQARRQGVERPFLTHISSVNDAPFGGW